MIEFETWFNSRDEAVDVTDTEFLALQDGEFVRVAASLLNVGGVAPTTVSVTGEGALGALTGQATATNLTYQATLSPSSPEGWFFDVTPPDDITLLIDPTGKFTRWRAIAGGWSAPTHIAAIRRRLPETDDAAVRGAITATLTFELPENFYNQQESYMRFFTFSNDAAIMKTSGVQVGALSSREWRLGLLIYGGADMLPRLVSNHDGGEEIVLWTGSTPLPTGLVTVSIDFTPSQTTTGAVTLWINGVAVLTATNVKTVPATLTPAEIIFTRIGVGIDDALVQSTKQVIVYLHGLAFYAQENVVIPDDTTTPSTLTDNFNDNSIDGTKWTSGGGGTVAESSAKMNLTVLDTVAAAPYLASASRFTLVSKSFTSKLVDAGFSGGLAADVSDDYNRADGAPGADYDGDTSAWEVEGNTLYQAPSYTATAITHVDALASVDMDIAADWIIHSGEGSYHAMRARVQDPADTGAADTSYQLTISSTGTVVQISRVILGVEEILESANNTLGNFQGTTCNMRLQTVTVGSDVLLNGWVAGVHVFQDVLDDDPAAILTGDYFGVGNYYEGRIDNLSAGTFGGAADDDWQVHPLVVYPVNADTGTWTRVTIVGSGSTMKVEYRVGGTTTALGEMAYDPAVHVYFKVAESNSAIAWSYSTNGIDWTLWAAFLSPFISLTSCQIRMFAEAAAPTADHTAILDDFNLLPTPTPPPPTDTGEFFRPTSRSQVGPRIALTNDTRTTLPAGTYTGLRFVNSVATLPDGGAYIFIDCHMPFNPGMGGTPSGRTVHMVHCSTFGYAGEGGFKDFTLDWCFVSGNVEAWRPHGVLSDADITSPTPMLCRSTWFAREGPVPAGAHCNPIHMRGGRYYEFEYCVFETVLDQSIPVHTSAWEGERVRDSYCFRCEFGIAGSGLSPWYLIYAHCGHQNVDSQNHFNECVVRVLNQGTRPLVAGDFYLGTTSSTGAPMLQAEKPYLNGIQLT